MTASAVPRARLVVAHPERKAQRALQRVVGATRCPIDVVGDVAALLKAVDHGAVAIVDHALAVETPELLAHPARAWIAVPGEGVAPAEANTISALLSAGWKHVLAQPMPILAEELLATTQKLLRSDGFGLEKYVSWGAEIRSRMVENALARENAVTAIAKDVVDVGLPARVASLVSVIADELLANAIYIAPIDEAGKRYRAGDPRDHSRMLAGRDLVRMRWAADARYIAIEVRDRWGSIDPGAVAKRLASAVTQNVTSSDGGMGLALAYACCTQLVIDLAPGALTEMIALVDIRHKPTELGRVGSFHFFTANAPPEEP